jgi:uncharacterized membrane protein YebE (DUF533 family)
MAKKNSRKVIDKLLTLSGLVAMLALFAIGGTAWWAYSFTTSNVQKELTGQKVYFPPKGSAALDPKEFPGLQQYAGQLVDHGPKAKAYADEFIGVHLKKIANGKTYAEVSNEAMADPTNQALQQEKATLFQGETLRALLLGNAYAFWTVGHIAQIAAIVSFIAGGLMLILVLLGWRHYKSVN